MIRCVVFTFTGIFSIVIRSILLLYTHNFRLKVMAEYARIIFSLTRTSHWRYGHRSAIDRDLQSVSVV